MRREAVTAVPHSVRFREQLGVVIRSSTATETSYAPSPTVLFKALRRGTVRGTTCLSALGILCFPGILVRG
jgi:hypothetical protein